METIEQRMTRLRNQPIQTEAIAKAALEKARAVAALQTPPPVPVSLSESLSGLSGPAAIGIAAVGLGLKQLYSTLKEASEFQEKLSRTISEQTERLDKLSTSWAEASKNSRTYGDSAKLLEAITKELDNVSEHTRQLNNTQVTMWQNLKEGALTAIRLTSGLPGLWTPYTDALHKAQEDQKQVAKDAESLGARMAQAAKQSREAWEALQLEPIDQAISEVTARLDAYKAVLDTVDLSTKTGIEDAAFYTRQLLEQEEQLRSLTQTQREQEAATRAAAAAQEKAAREAGRAAETARKAQEDAYDSASPQAKAILRNEKAARDAQARGDEISADQFQKSADQLKQSASEADLKSYQDVIKAYGGAQRPKTIADQIEENRKAFEAAEGSQDFSGAGTFGKSGLIGPAAERERRQGIEQTRKDSNDALEKKMDEMITLQREQLGIWR